MDKNKKLDKALGIKKCDSCARLGHITCPYPMIVTSLEIDDFCSWFVKKHYEKKRKKGGD